MVRIHAIGQCAIELDGRRLSTESEVVFGLVLYLAARAGEVITRDDLQALLWPGLSSTRGRHCLRQAAYRIRQLGVTLRSENDSLGIALGDVTSDFAALSGDDVPAARFADVPIGDILPGYQPTFSLPFAAWVEDHRTSIGGRIRKGLVRAIIDLRSKGRYREAEPLARLCLTSDPFNEVATLTLAEATAVLSGNRAEALAILDRYMDEVDTSPDRRLSLTASVLRRRISERFVEQRYAAPPDPPFVGREDILQLLVEKMQEAVAGRSTIVYVWGEPGIGKTRLLEELAKVAHVQGVRIERYAVTPNDPDRPLALFSSLLPRLMRLPGAVGISPEAFEAIQRFIDPSAWERVEPPANAAEAAVTFGRLKSGICELFEALSEERPLGLFVDDVHWIDARSVEVLADVVERVRKRRITVALTSQHSLARAQSGKLESLCTRAAVRQLSGLEAVEVESLLVRIAEQRHFLLTSDFVRRTVDTSAGNPLFVSELATHYSWNGVRDDLPHNLQTLLQRRLESLSDEALIVFQACAVLAEHATVDRLANVVQSPTHHLLRALSEIEHSSLLVTASGRILCRHDLLRRAALTRLPPITRQALNRTAATVLEVEALRELDATLCWHAVRVWLDAEAPNRASRLVVRMAARLLGSGLAKDADELLHNARAVTAEEPHLVEFLPLQLRAARARGDLRKSLALALEFQRLSKGKTNGLDEASFAEFAAFDASRSLEAGWPHDLGLRRIEAAAEPPDVLLELALRIVIAADDRVDPLAAVRCFALLNAKTVLERASIDRRTIFELVYHSHFGELEYAADIARRFLVPAGRRRTEDLSTRARRLRWAHRPLLLCGHFEEALAALDQSVAAAKNCGSALDEIASECYRIDVLVSANRLDEAVHTLAQIDDRCASDVGSLVRITTAGARAELMFALGRSAELRVAITEIDATSHHTERTRARLGIDSIHTLQALSEGNAPDAVRLEYLRGLWQDFRSLGSADLTFLAICGASLASGEPQHVTDLCADYPRWRREKCPIAVSFVARFRTILSTWGLTVPAELDQILVLASARG